MANWNHRDLLRENAGQSDYQEHSEALFLTSSFRFRSAAEAAEKFAQVGAEYVYSRFSNPTVTTFNRRIAIVEDAEFALSTSSGMAAILSTVMGFCESGSRVVCSANVFGATRQLLSTHIKKFGVQVHIVRDNNPDSWRQAADGKATLFLLETPSNPMQEVIDLAALRDIAKTVGALLVVDNCFCAGAQQPLKWGADLVVHSATKYLDGQGRVLGGVIAGQKELLMERVYPFLRTAGPALSPFNAWVLLKGLETLPLRMRAHSAAALALAEWLGEQPTVRRVWHTALATHPGHDLAMRQQNGLGGGLITVAVNGGQAAAWRFIDSLRCFSITANFGDTKSTVTHPSSTTHQRLSPAEQQDINLSDDTVRLSIGLESVDDLRADLRQALSAIS